MKARWHSTFLGVRQQHCYGLYALIDRVLRAAPKVGRFVEIGTGGGALSVVLALHAFQRETCLLTFDIQERGHLSKVMSILDRLNVERQLLDCFGEEAKSRIANYIGETPCFFFCDGGDKPREFNHFAPVLPKGSIIAAHDYTSKGLNPARIQETINALNLIPVHQELWVGGVDDIRTCFYKT